MMYLVLNMQMIIVIYSSSIVLWKAINQPNKVEDTIKFA